MSKNVTGILIVVIAILAIGGIYLSSKSDKPASTSQPTQSTNSQTSPQQANSGQNAPLTAEEVAKHNSGDDCWTIIDGDVYNVTSFIANHPGGSEILRACGIDASTLFDQRHTANGQPIGSGTPHSSNARSTLETLKIGPLQQ